MHGAYVSPGHLFIFSSGQAGWPADNSAILLAKPAGIVGHIRERRLVGRFSRRGRIFIGTLVPLNLRPDQELDQFHSLMRMSRVPGNSQTGPPQRAGPASGPPWDTCIASLTERHGAAPVEFPRQCGAGNGCTAPDTVKRRLSRVENVHGIQFPERYDAAW
jgi:hypothetical protein